MKAYHDIKNLHFSGEGAALKLPIYPGLLFDKRKALAAVLKR